MSQPAGATSRSASGATNGVLATKLYVPPRQPGFVPRPRLVEQLNDGLERALILVCAPAGFGKTALLADWSQAGQRAPAWISLDAGDNDPARFWRHAIAALDRVQPGVAELTGPLFGPPAPPSFEGPVAALVNELAGRSWSDEVVLVLDDYHLIDSRAVHTSVAFLLEHLPPRVHLVLSSRADPPLALARLRGRRQLAELRAADLRFTIDEAAALLRDAVGPDLPLPDTTVATLTDRTEGWAAGLQLAALSLRGRPDAAAFLEAFSGSHRYILDYLTEEVLERQPGSIRNFLLETSILERLSGPLCDAVTGRSDGQQLLEEIERANLFLVPMDEMRRWWRYHHLFADLLRARLQQEQPARFTKLHRSAAAWYEEHALADEAVRHARAAGDVDLAARLIEQHAGELLLRGEGATVERWLAALPGQIIQGRPRLLLAQVVLAIQGGQVEAVDGLLDAAERAYADVGQESEAPSVDGATGGLANVPGRIAHYRAYVAELHGDIDATITFGSRALVEFGDGQSMMASLVRAHLAVADWLSGRLPDAERVLSSIIDGWHAAGLSFQVASQSHFLGQVHRAQGDLDTELETYHRALEITAVPGRPPLPAAGIPYVGMAEVAYQRGDLDTAMRHITDGIALCRQLAYTQPLATGLADLAWIRQAQGDPAGALEAITEATEVAPGSDVVDLLNPVPASRARLLLVLGDVDAAAAWTVERGLDADDEPTYPREPAHLLLARVLIAQDRTEQASRLLDRLLGTATEQGRFGSAIEIHGLRALAHAARGEVDGALDALAEAVTLAAPQGWLRVFVDEGQPMATLLARLVAKRGRDLTRAGVSLGYLSRLGAAMEPESARGASPGNRLVASRSATIPGLIEALSERELEVLHLLAAGKANREIADELFVTLDTVKKHTTHILGKLGATNRTEAAAHARELGLIP